MQQWISKSGRYLPAGDVLREASGYAVLGLGLFIGLAIYSYSPGATNLAGPVGHRLASLFLHSLGIISALIPMLMIVFGSALVLGFQFEIAAKRFVGFFSLVVIAASMFAVQMMSFGVNRPSFGFGGHIGDTFANAALRNLGYGGATILFTILAFIALAISGNIALSRLRSLTIFWMTRSFQYLTALRKTLQGEEAASDEELIKQALVAELKQSSHLLKKRIPSASKNDVSEAPTLKRKKSDPSSIDLDSLVDEASESLAAGNDSEQSSITLNFYYDGKTHGKPTSTLFTRSSKAKDRASEFKKMADKLTQQLSQFKVEGKVTKIVEGPVVTTFEFEPLPGTKVSKITGLSQDLARLLQASSLRILAPIPGKKVIGFEVPNSERRMIGFADLVEHRDLKSSKVQLPVAMGMDAFGHVIIEDLAKMPHLLVAGSTGSGKSVFMNTLIGGLIARHSAKDLRFVMIDPKMVELAAYNDLPHMACPVITDPAGEAKDKLDALVSEMEDRFRKMQQLGARNLQGFNEIIRKGKRTDFPNFTDKWQTMPFIVLIIDELADMMMVLGKDAEIPITRLAQKARAAGIHLVIATQRPSADVVTGLIKANFPTRIAFRVLSGLDSRTILDTSGAEGLIGQGDMLFLNAAGLRRMHGAYLSDSEVHAMVKASK